MTRHRDTAAHILVVDDDQRIRQMLTRYFEQERYRVSVAADGPAMRAQLNNSVDVILLDVVMPGEDGLTLAPRDPGKLRCRDHHVDGARRCVVRKTG